MTIKEQITEDMKGAMRAHDKAKLSALRMLLAGIKQREVDDRAEPTDEMVTGVISKLIKQRRDSVDQYTKAGRQDLADKEQFEIDTLSVYLPKQMSEEEIRAVVQAAVSETGAAGMAQMGKVMGVVKGKVAGKADMGKVSAIVRAVLSGK
ncbi:MAG: GatB/YqeY domain-containing protein [Duodenibacillus sp.]|nr:GatB/YqeY domain-containing protein [Duodenibacillus sp.]HBC69231.1 glutamyl-tRNA amidotransferase [Sutterella sp.]